MKRTLFILALSLAPLIQASDPAPIPKIGISWDFEFGFRDVLQISEDCGKTWECVPGPYVTRPSTRLGVPEGSYQYFIILYRDWVLIQEGAIIYRVCRWFGNPWVVEMPPASAGPSNPDPGIYEPRIDPLCGCPDTAEIE